jgi:hypothetical protein
VSDLRSPPECGFTTDLTKMNRPWLTHYPPGVPHVVHPEQYRSLSALLE